jgi:hypothetical protein
MSNRNRNHATKTPTNSTTEAPTMYETENDIPKSARVELNALINQRLADVINLQLQLKQAHWKPNRSSRCNTDHGSAEVCR